MAHDILIVDDEDDIRNLIAGILEDEGYETRQAANSADAFSVIAAREVPNPATSPSTSVSTLRMASAICSDSARANESVDSR